MSKKRGWREKSGFVPKGLLNDRTRKKRNNSRVRYVRKRIAKLEEQEERELQEDEFEEY